MKKYISILFILIIQFVNAQESTEQIAFEYFIKNVIRTDFPNEKLKIKFSGYTQPYTSGAYTTNECIKKIDSPLIINGFKESDAIKIERKPYLCEINKSIKNVSKKKLILNIYKSIDIEDKKVVSVILTEKNIRTYEYYITIGKDKNVINWCKTIVLN